jgi:hypothetical protein
MFRIKFNNVRSKDSIHVDEIIVKGARGAKGKIIFQELHMTRVIPTLVYSLKLCILDTPFSIAF